ncbi:hypothetical protein [Elizabethkingia miricola]|uniref:hypothetical protein n=1 Tax=Elizabethkingia miricola TaxID=172045 RepID=UPI0009993B0C|nr:hypothetical protein [Elizabethkingia miricola]OPC36184.1 hypothetical protein BAX99_19195 [Elizabethkingia miricola]
MKNANKPINPAFIRFTEDDEPFLGTSEQHSLTSLGITKREYFAGIAMQALIPHWNIMKGVERIVVAELAIKMSDELLKQLENTK